MSVNTVLTDSAESTKVFANKIARDLKGGNVVLLRGDLGAGKTTFTQGLGQYFGIHRMTSPTYVLLNQYKVENHPTIKTFYHFDLYRLENVDQLRSVNFDEITTDKNGIVILEWPERLGTNLPKGSINIRLNIVESNKREITVQK